MLLYILGGLRSAHAWRGVWLSEPTVHLHSPSYLGFYYLCGGQEWILNSHKEGSFPWNMPTFNQTTLIFSIIREVRFL